MSVTRPTDLFYGHLGEATYDISSHQWHFSRISQITRKIEPLGPPLIVLKPSITQSSFEDVKTAAERSESIKKLTRSFPELVPGLSCFPELAQESELIRKNASRHDPATSDLFAFGKANAQRSGDRRLRTRPTKVPILAVAGGSTGDAVRLIRLAKEYIGWEKDNSPRLTNLLLQDEEQGWWFTNGSPLQQLCFAGLSGTSKARLAVRYHGAITVLEPMLHANLVPEKSRDNQNSRRAKYAESRLDANPLLTITTERTGGSPHAHVSFNPWHTAQFAIIDRRGHWTLWELKQSSQLLDQKVVDAGPSGFVFDGEVDLPEPNAECNSGDGWGSIMWAGDRSTLVVANRKTFSVFSIENDTKRLYVPQLFEPKSADQIIDMKRSPVNFSHIFLLTSSRIFWLKVFDHHNHRGGGLEPGAQILLSWVHFRDQQDSSLCLNVLDDGHAIMVVLYSRLTSLSTIFTFEMSQAPLSIPMSTSDPYLLPLTGNEHHSKLHGPQNRSRKTPSISSLELRSTSYIPQNGSTPTGSGVWYREKPVRFYYLSVLYSDLSLQRCLYVGQATTDPTRVLLPMIHSGQNPFGTAAFVSGDGFIVPNRVSAKGRDVLSLNTEMQIAPKKNAKGYQSNAGEDPRTLNFEWLERGIRSLLTGTFRPGTRVSSGVSFDECLKTLKAETENKLNNGTPQLKLLLEMLSTTVAVQDVDAVSESLHEFSRSLGKSFVNNEEDDQNICKFLHVSEILSDQISAFVLPSLAISQNLSLSHIYDSILNLWISSLPKTIPSRVRITAEKDVRDIAVQLSLTGMGVHVGSWDREENVVIEEPRSSLDDVFNLTLRSKISLPRLSVAQLEKSQRPSSSPLVSSQISEDTGFMPPFFGSLPTPEPTPSLRSKSPSVVGTEDPASKRLRAFANLAPQPVLPLSASNILRHWSEGSDPAMYDFEATERSIRMELESETLVDEATAKKQQRREKRLKRQRERSTASSSQPEPTRIRASQSVPPPESDRNEDGQQLSSHGMERLPLPSQMEKGASGGFTVSKTGKWKDKGKLGKKRAPGF